MSGRDAFRRLGVEGVADHFLRVAVVDSIAVDDGACPGFTCERFEAAKFAVGGWVRREEDEVAGFRGDQQSILIGEQDDLAASVAAFFPGALSIGEVDAGEKGDVETIGMVIVDDYVGEFGLQIF